jgi:alpha-galactosidase
LADQQLTRRTFLQGAAAMSGTMLALPRLDDAQSSAPARAHSSDADILRPPDLSTAYCGLGTPVSLARDGDQWTSKNIRVSTEVAPNGEELLIRLVSPNTPVTHLHLRWKVQSAGDLRCLGDAWERSYGDLEWQSIVPNRAMPWYFLTFADRILRGYGVKTQPSAFCFWQLDTEGISLWADIRNGGSAPELGERQLDVATVVTYVGNPEETAFAGAQNFCKRMSTAPRLPKEPLCGSNDWYYAYGKNTAEGILRNADLVAQVASGSGSRPFVVIDDGWQDKARFPDLAGLAKKISSRKLRPGIWIRPLRAPQNAKPSLLLPDARFGAQQPSPAWDPTIPEALEFVLDSVKQPVSWGYEFIKHDFSTFELFGRWGSAMGALPTEGDWHFADRSRTNAEIILRFYQSLRQAAGEQVVILGCNTIGHLCAGIFESQRIGDDNSGTKWERTRRMGVNALAFRMPQHGSFFHVDPDCVALTSDIDWYFTRQWLDVVSRSGTSLFISPGQGAMGSEQIAALKDAFSFVQHSSGYAEDWLENTTPRQWLFRPGGNVRMRYDWSGETGAFPFPV